MNLKPYIQIARPDHWIKNVFIVPGVILALFADRSIDALAILPTIALGLLAACLAATTSP